MPPFFFFTVLSDDMRDDNVCDLLRIRLALTTLRSILCDHTERSMWHEAVGITTDLFKCFQQHVTYKEYAKVCTGLKTLVISV